MSNKPNLNLELVEQGTFNWDAPINSNWEKIDAWAAVVASRMQFVNSLPQNPDSNTYYFIPA